MRSSKLTVFALICWVAVWGRSGSHSLADDWTMFGRDQTRNAVSPEVGPPTDWSIGKYDDRIQLWNRSRNILWAAPLGTQTFGDPVVADGRVWVGINNSLVRPSFGFREEGDASVLAGFDTRDGAPLYRYVSPRIPRNSSVDWPLAAMACSPLVEGNRMWFTTNLCETVCLDLAPMKGSAGPPRVVWKIDMMKRFGVVPHGSIMMVCHFCSIAAYKDLIFVITGNGAPYHRATVPAPNAPSLICFKKDSGEVVWQDNSPGANILDGQWTSPLVIETDERAQVVAPQGDGWLRSFDVRTGKLVWKFDINLKTSLWSMNQRSERNNILATPVFYDGRVYIASGRYAEIGEGPGRLVCIDPTKTGDISSELAVDAAGQPLPVSRLQAVDEKKGQRAVPNPNSGLVWEYTKSDRNGDGKTDFEETFHRTYANVVIKDNLLVAGDWGGLVHCLDAKTGKVHWSHDRMASIYASPVVVEDKVYVADEDGKVAIFKLSPESRGPLAEMEFDGGICTSPVFANGVLYVATNYTLFAIQSPQSAKAPETGGNSK